ncbi:hypothetical protein XF36_03020 [Pseudonocardia sp. HH130629-09]|nr:hypothetical protein XF36_03020 [Pseudonocardia sp. HH130629-09]
MSTPMSRSWLSATRGATMGMRMFVLFRAVGIRDGRRPGHEVLSRQYCDGSRSAATDRTGF